MGDSDILTRLREASEWGREYGNPAVSEMYGLAADELSRLRKIEEAARRVKPLAEKAFVELRSRGVASGLVADLTEPLWKLAAALETIEEGAQR